MPITITVTGDSPQDVQAQIGALLFGMPDAHARFAPIFSAPAVEHAPAPSQPLPPGEGTQMVGDKPKRGRPKKDTTAEQPPGTVWETRRYGGESDLEFTSEREACERLVELIHNAGSEQALDSLMKANADLASNIAREWREQIEDAEKNVRAAFAPAAKPEGVQEAPAPAAPAGYTDVNGNPLTEITLDATGAKHAIRAIATGAPPKLSFNVASGILSSHGLKKLSEMKDDDPRHALIAREAAALLGLPVVEPGEQSTDPESLFA